MTARNPLQLVAVLLPILLYSLFRFSVGPLLPSLQDNLMISVAVSGALVSASTITVGIGTALTGYFVSKIGERRTAILGLLIFSIPLATSTIFSRFDVFATLFVVSGFGGGLMITPAYPMAAALFPRRKGTAVGVVSASYNLGGFIGPVISGILLNYLGWQFPFLAIGLIGLIFALAFRSGLSGFQTPQKETTSTFSADLGRLVSNRNVLVSAAAEFLTDLGFFAFVTYTIQYFSDRFSLSSAALVWTDVYFGLAVGIGGLGVIVTGHLYDKAGGKITSVLTSSAIAVASLGLYSATSFGFAVVILFVVGFFLNSPFGLLSVIALADVPEHSRASAVSFVQTAAYAGGVLGLLVAAVLFGSSVTAGPLLLTVTIPYAVSAGVLLTLHSKTSIQGPDKA